MRVQQLQGRILTCIHIHMGNEPRPAARAGFSYAIRQPDADSWSAPSEGSGQYERWVLRQRTVRKVGAQAAAVVSQLHVHLSRDEPRPPTRKESVDRCTFLPSFHCYAYDAVSRTRDAWQRGRPSGHPARRGAAWHAAGELRCGGPDAPWAHAGAGGERVRRLPATRGWGGRGPRLARGLAVPRASVERGPRPLRAREPDACDGSPARCVPRSSGEGATPHHSDGEMGSCLVPCRAEGCRSW